MADGRGQADAAVGAPIERSPKLGDVDVVVAFTDAPDADVPPGVPVG